MTRRTPSLSRAVAFLEHRIVTGIFLPADPLPGVTVLAWEADVAPFTMWKALDALRTKGLITGGRGKRFRLSAAPAALPSDLESRGPAKGRTKWERSAGLFAQDIHSGHWQREKPLPSIKELQRRYGVSYRTMRKMIDSLLDERLLRPVSGGYVVPGITAASSHLRFHLVTWCESADVIQVGLFGNELLRALENVCLRARIVFDVVTAELTSGDTIRLFNRKTQEFIEPGQLTCAIGIIIFVNTTAAPWERLSRLVSMPRKPCVICDIAGDWRFGIECARVQPTKIFSITQSRQMSISVARCLLDYGHRRCAFISAFHANIWSQTRLASMMEVFKSGGGVLQSFTAEKIWEDLTLSTIHGVEFDALMAPLDAWITTRVWRDSTEQRSFLSCALQQTMTNGAYYEALHPLFERAFTERKNTAWICVNDNTALFAWDFLKKRGVQVPEDISLISFDDSTPAMIHNFTSYRFDSDAVAHRAVRHLLAGTELRKYRFVGPQEIEGMLIERGSVRRRS